MAKEPITSEITEHRKKLEENPDSLAFAPLADAYRREGNLEEALKVCKRGLEKHPSYTSARVVFGRILQDKGNHEEAAAEFKKVLDADPENLMAHSLMGSIYVSKGDFQAAIEEYQKILTLNPDDEETQASLKQAIEKAAGEQKKQKPAKKEPEGSGAKGQTRESTASLTIAELYLKQGHFDKAIEVYQELLANDPQNLMLRQKLSEIVDRQQKEMGTNAQGSKLKQNEFIRPPDQKEDVIVDDARTAKGQGKPKQGDDSKFTSEDILQVMRKGGKDDVVMEEKMPPVLKKSTPTPAAQTTVPEKIEAAPRLRPEQVDNLKGVLAELGAVSGILRCFLIDRDGINVVSVGETSNNADLGKQVSAIFESTRRSVSQMNQGKLQQVLVTAETGHILLVSFANFVLIVLADSKINLGLLRLALDSALKKLDKIL